MSNWGELHRCASCAYFRAKPLQDPDWGGEPGWCYSTPKELLTKADRPACATYRQDLPDYARCRPGEFISYTTIETMFKDLNDDKTSEGGTDD